MRVAGRELTERNLIALIALIILVAALIGSGMWMQMRAKADAKARAAAEAALAAQPRQAPPITTSVYVRSVPVRPAR